MPRPVEALPCGSRSTTSTRSPTDGQRRAEIDCRGGLADAALLVGDRQVRVSPALVALIAVDPRLASGVFASNARTTTIRPPASVRLGSSSPANSQCLSARLRISTSRPLRNSPTRLTGERPARQPSKRGKGAKRARGDDVHRAKLQVSRGFFDRRARWPSMSGARATSPRKAALAYAFDEGDLSAVAPASMIASTRPGKAGAGAEIGPGLGFRRRSARSWAESAKWRDQIASSVLGPTRFMVFCHCVSRAS